MTTATSRAMNTSPSEGIPLYLRIGMSLRTRINHGEWPEDATLPSFESLAKEYGVSLNTIRGAIQLLVNEGFVTSSRGVGTKVLARPIHHSHLRSSISDPLELAEHVSIEIIESQEVSHLPTNLQEHYLGCESYRKIQNPQHRSVAFCMARNLCGQTVLQQVPQECREALQNL